MEDKYYIVIYSLDKDKNYTFLYGYCIKENYEPVDIKNNENYKKLCSENGFSLMKNQFYINKSTFDEFYNDLNLNIFNIKHLIGNLKEDNVNIELKRNILQPYRYINTVNNDNEQKNITKNEIFYITNFEDFLEKEKIEKKELFIKNICEELEKDTNKIFTKNYIARLGTFEYINILKESKNIIQYNYDKITNCSNITILIHLILYSETNEILQNKIYTLKPKESKDINNCEEEYYRYKIWTFDKNGDLLDYNHCSYFYNPKPEYKRIYNTTRNLYNLIGYQEYKFDNIQFINNEQDLKDYFNKIIKCNCEINIYDPYFNEDSLNNIINTICRYNNKINYYCNSKTKNDEIENGIKNFRNKKHRIRYFGEINIYKINNNKFHDRYIYIKNNTTSIILSITKSINQIDKITEMDGITISEYNKIYNCELLKIFNDFESDLKKIETIKYEEQFEILNVRIPTDLFKKINNSKFYINLFNDIGILNFEINQNIDYLIKNDITEADYSFFKNLLIDKYIRGISELFKNNNRNTKLNDCLLNLYVDETKKFEKWFLNTNNQDFRVIFFQCFFSNTILFKKDFKNIVNTLIKSNILSFRCIGYYYLLQFPNLFDINNINELICHIKNVNKNVKNKELLFVYLVYLFEDHNIPKNKINDSLYFKDSTFKNSLDVEIVKNFNLSHQINIIYQLTEFLNRKKINNIRKYYKEVLENKQFIKNNNITDTNTIFFNKYDIEYLYCIINFYDKKCFSKYKQCLIKNINDYLDKLNRSKLLILNNYNNEYQNNITLILIDFLTLLILNKKFKKTKNIISIKKLNCLYNKILKIDKSEYSNFSYNELLSEIKTLMGK